MLTTVVSTPAANRAIVDAGSKILTSDLLGLTGYGHVLGRPDLAVDQLSEEHGRLVAPEATRFKVGDRLRIVPNHACVVSQHGRCGACRRRRRGGALARWRARGKVV